MMRRVSVVTALALAVTAGVWAQNSRSNPNTCDAGHAGLTLPDGFCASVVADNLGQARHMVVSPTGDLYVMIRREAGPDGSVIALRDADGDGRFEQRQRFGPDLNGTGILWRDGYLYVGADTRIVRFKMDGKALVPAGQPETIVEFPPQRGHTAKPFALGRNNELFVHVGAPSNACQDPDRRAEVPGQRPCPLLNEFGGVWKYDANRPGQKHMAANRYATGIRHTTSLMSHPVTGSLFQVQHGRDQLDTMWPKLFTAQQNGDLPAEEFHLVKEGSNFGWPYCYFDPVQNKRLQNPEYGGDGKKEGECAKYDKPIAAFPAHNAPLDLMFYTGTRFPEEYRGGAFVTFHGSWNRAPLPMDGYNIRFVPFKGDSPTGPHRVFASGFTGQPQIMNPKEAAYRPTGLVQALDGSIYVSDDVKGRIWKITYVGNRAGTGE
jgi:glucose/arabinose dehydrogenase